MGSTRRDEAVCRSPEAASGSRRAPEPRSRRLRGSQESVSLLSAAAVLRQPPTPERGEALLALLAPYRRRVVQAAGTLPIIPAGLPPARVHELTMRPAAPILLDVLLPACRDHLLDRLLASNKPLEGDPEDGLPSVIDLAEAMRTAVGALRGAGRQNPLLVIDAVEEHSRIIVQQALAETEDGDGAERIAELSATLLRLEGLRLVLETLGAPSGSLNEAAYQSRRVARLALRHAAETIRCYLGNSDLIRLRDSLTVLSGIDSLIVLALRILDALQGREEEPTPFVKVADEEVLDDYVEAITRLAEALFALVREVLPQPEFDPVLFTALTRKIKWLHDFCSRLDHDYRPLALVELGDYLVLQSAMLARRCGAMLAEALAEALAGEPAAARVLLVRAEDIVGLLTDMNRRHVQEGLEAVIAAAHTALDRMAP